MIKHSPFFIDFILHAIFQWFFKESFFGANVIIIIIIIIISIKIALK